MAIGINNSNFKMFTDFAAKYGEKSSKLAQFSDIISESGEKRTVRATNNGDFVGNVLRGDDKERDNNDVRKLFFNTVCDMFGGVKKLPENVKKAMKLGDYGKGKPLTARRILAVKKAIIKSSTFSVGGTGPCAAMMKNVLKTKLDSIPGTTGQKFAKLRTDMSNVAKNLTNLCFCAEMRNAQLGKPLQFDLDFNRNLFEVKLCVGGENIAISPNSTKEEQMNAIAKFVTRGKTQTFEELSAAEKNKAFAVLAFVNQHIGITMRNAVSLGLTTELNWQPLRLSGNEDSGQSKMTLSFDDAGALNIALDTLSNTPMQVGYYQSKTAGETTYYEFQPGAEMRLNLNVNISAGEFDRLCDLDYTKYDTTAPDAKMKTKNLVDPYNEATKTIGDFRFGAGVTFDLGFSANFTDCTVI